MPTAMHIVYAKEHPPESYKKSLFLAGPSPRKADDMNWRLSAITILERLGYDGVVYIPLPRDGRWPASYDDQVAWERRYLDIADSIVFWVPRDLGSLPGFTTNVEFGMYLDSGRLILGRPDGAPKMRYLDYHMRTGRGNVHTTLEDTLRAAVDTLGAGALRTGGERDIPLIIWNSSMFQQWYEAQLRVGNRIDGARQLWQSHQGPGKKHLFAFALDVDVHVVQEERNKRNEFIISRPDIAVILAYLPGTSFEETKVLLLREFRSAVNTPDGFVHELPGGSSWVDADIRLVAQEEFREETGMTLDIDRFEPIAVRQLAGTFSTHRAHLFRVAFTGEEMYQAEQDTAVHGSEEGGSERTFLEVVTVRDILSDTTGRYDWTTVGMILAHVPRPS